jgi:hypothetical protein
VSAILNGVSAVSAPGSDRAARARAAWSVWGLGAVAVLLPAGLAASHLVNTADAAHDEAVVRALGLGWTGAFRALDAAWAGLFAWLPVGTRALRAGLASAAACGLGGGVVFALARGVLGRGAEKEEAGGFAAVVACIAALAATLAPAWQTEAASAAGSTLGAVLALAPAAVWMTAPGRGPLVGLLAGLAVSYEPMVGLVAVASVGAGLAAEPGARRGLPLTFGAPGASPMAAAFMVGLAPFALAFARKRSLLATTAGAFASAWGERGASETGMPLAFAREEIGAASCVLAIAGAVLVLRQARSRGAGAILVAAAGVGLGAIAFGAPAGPTRYGPAVLAGVGAAYALAAAAMHGVVVAVGNARLPFARASAAMILVLEGAIPARAADDAATRADVRPRASTAAWDDVAFGALPAGAEILVRDPRVHMRLQAARASGEFRADLGVLPLFDLGDRSALRELARDAKLEPLWRDAALLGKDEESSLSSIAQERPLIAPYDPSWDRLLARHLVPAGLFARFEPEPRGASDRRRALDDLSPAADHPLPPGVPSERERLLRALDGDPELLGMTARLLRTRAVALAAASERDVVARALDDLRPFSPRDPVATEIVKRMAASRGAIDVKDLNP